MICLKSKISVLVYPSYPEGKEGVAPPEGGDGVVRREINKVCKSLDVIC